MGNQSKLGMICCWGSVLIVIICCFAVFVINEVTDPPVFTESKGFLRFFAGYIALNLIAVFACFCKQVCYGVDEEPEDIRLRRNTMFRTVTKQNTEFSPRR